MRIVVTQLLCALSTVILLSSGALAAEPPSTVHGLPAAVVVAPIFGELFAHSIPAGFRRQHEQTNGQLYLRSMVLESDADANWKQRILISGTQDAAKVNGLTPRAFAMQIARGFQQSCPSTFSGGVVLEGKIKTGHNTCVMIVSCGTHTLTTTKIPTSETALVAVVQGDQNYYSVQWSERSSPVATVPVAEVALWSERLKAIAPLLVCERKPGEAAPYPSCTQRPQ